MSSTIETHCGACGGRLGDSRTYVDGEAYCWRCVHAVRHASVPVPNQDQVFTLVLATGFELASERRDDDAVHLTIRRKQG